MVETEKILLRFIFKPNCMIKSLIGNISLEINGHISAKYDCRCCVCQDNLLCICARVSTCWNAGGKQIFVLGSKQGQGEQPCCPLCPLSIGAQRTPLPMIHSNPGFGQSRCRPCQANDLRPPCPEVPEHDVLSEAASLFSPRQGGTFIGL